MRRIDILESELQLPDFHKNLARMLNENAARFFENPIYQEIHGGEYVSITWKELQTDIHAIQGYLKQDGMQTGDRVAILSRNRQEMLEIELGVMAMGAIAVPIFAGYGSKAADSLVGFCEPKIVAVADQEQYDKLDSPRTFSKIIHFDPISSPKSDNLVAFQKLLGDGSVPEGSPIEGESLPGDTVALMMYTSGTMGQPKCVQLTHGNILSQQSAMRVLWKLSHRDRFLSYLPWHHSFGGIFEKYAALTNGAVLSLEHGYGKDIDILLANWERVRPTVFFSVPRIYQELATRVVQDQAIDRMVFHDELRFIFTAAAPLPGNISRLFENRGTPIVEGWGLTETSPCCTVTDPKVSRETGVVGKPIPGVALSLAADGEILVKGPNVMKGYYKNDEATRKVLTRDGWFHTGDVGEFTETGLNLISRKDRIFKLSNAEKVIPSEIESLITRDCAYLAQAYVTGSGKDHPVALLFPNKALLSQIPDESRLKKGCDCPRDLQDFSRCLTQCLSIMNQSLDVKYNRLHAAMLVDYELTIENNELTPSMKLAPNVIGRVFKANIEHLYGESTPVPDKVYVINLE